ncbi:MAG: acyl-CoA dehydrogenase family protein [Saprospiraceae bacterium]
MHHQHFTEEHELFRQSFRSFLEREAAPHIDKWEDERRTPRKIWKKMGSMGYLGLSYPEKYGGQDLDFFFDVVFNEELGRMNSGGFAITQQVVQYMSGPYILKYGSDSIKKKYLPGLIAGDLISSIGITEPSAGSDVQNIQTRAVKNGDHYVVNGSKTFITNGVYGDLVVTVVKTGADKGATGISLLVIEQKMEGVSTRKLKKLGWHCSDTAEMSFDNVKVPLENLIGEEGRGFYYLMNGLQLERICAMPAAVTACDKAIETSLQYMSERKAFGRSINKFQVLRHRIAQLAAEVEALRSFTYHCCDMYNRGIYDVKLCSMLKIVGSELAEKVATQCLQFFGGYGFMEDYPMARMYRDVRVGTIGGGTSEVMREILAKMIIDDVNFKKEPSSIVDRRKTKAKNKPPKDGNEEKGNSTGEDRPSFKDLLSEVSQKAMASKAIKNTIKFDFGDNQIFIDGAGSKNIVSDQNKNAHCIVKISLNDFCKLLTGDLDHMNAMMSGKMVIEGDMGVAIKLESLFS